MSAFRRHLMSRVMTVLVIMLSFTAVLALVLILGNLLVKGASSIDWAFFTKSPVPAGQSGGGVANAIVGTGIIVGLGALIGVPIGVGIGIYLAEYGSGRFGFLVRFIADVLNGTPSIVIGIVGWTFLVKPMGRFSALAGSVALAILMIPMLARTTEEMVRLVPHSLREAALALGYPRWRTSLRIVARTALSGIVTGCLVGDRPHRRRDRAAAVHRAGQPQLFGLGRAADADAVAADLRVRHRSVRRVAPAGVGVGARADGTRPDPFTGRTLGDAGTLW